MYHQRHFFLHHSYSLYLIQILEYILFFHSLNLPAILQLYVLRKKKTIAKKLKNSIFLSTLKNILNSPLSSRRLSKLKELFFLEWMWSQSPMDTHSSFGALFYEYPLLWISSKPWCLDNLIMGRIPRFILYSSKLPCMSSVSIHVCFSLW